MKKHLFIGYLCLGTALPLSASYSQELEDVFGGFDEEESVLDYIDDEPDEEEAETQSDVGELSGSVVVSASYNYRDHTSNSGTDYSGLQKLRTRLNLEYDYDFNDDWRMHIAGYAFYDFAYEIQGRDNYTDEVLDAYESEAEFQDVYIQGKLQSDIDLKVGRQVVNWGRSDSLRVLDVLNPLDNREPGLADIEDIRLSVGMIKADYYVDEWNASLIAIPEIRFSKNPPYGSDFATVVDPFNSGFRTVFEEEVPEDWEDTSWAAALTGIFSGWDISFHAAYYWRDIPYLDPVFDPTDPNLGFFDSTLKHSRLTMLGTGGNYTFGSWLVKGEIAWQDNIDYTTTTFIPMLGISVPSGVKNTHRLDTMVGVEYYGIGNTTFAFEIVNRHIAGFEQSMEALFEEEDSVEAAFRYTQSFLNDKLDVTGLVFGGFDDNGGGARADASYEVVDALTVSGGVIYYHEGEQPPFNTIYKNDRIFAEVKYSF